MDNQDKNDVFLFWSDRLIWNDLTDTWNAYDEYRYFLLNNDDK